LPHQKIFSCQEYTAPTLQHSETHVDFSDEKMHSHIDHVLLDKIRHSSIRVVMSDPLEELTVIVTIVWC